MTDEDIERITRNAVRVALQQDREERDRQSQLDTQAAVAAALANQTNQVQALRRPDLPPFDKANIEAWIKRVEFAFSRVNITNAQSKFSFIDKLFTTRDDAKVNSFLWGPQTTVRWTEFLEYLREKYGRTKKQEVYSLLTGIPRDGQRPTELAALIDERTANITLDDVKKEVLLKEIPVVVREHLAATLDGLTFTETAKACDAFFDQQGKLKEKNNATSINHVSSLRQPQPQPQQQQQQQQPKQTYFTAPFTADDEDTDVNAVRFRSGQRQNFNVSNRSSSRGGSNSTFNNNNNAPRNNNSNRFGGASSSSMSSSRNPPAQSSNKVCKFHTRWGEQAENCEGQWCILKHKMAPKGQASR